MKKYNIIDEKGYYWCVDKGVAINKETGHQIKNFGYWGKRKFAIDEDDWKRRKRSMNIISAIFLKIMMKIEGLNIQIKDEKHSCI